MKKTFICLLLSLLSISSWSQIFLVNSFKLQSSEGEYGIYADIDCEGDKEVFFDMGTNDPSEYSRIKLTNSRSASFFKFLNNAMDKFEEWQDVAEQNQVVSLSKQIGYSFNSMEIEFSQNGEWYRSSIDLNAIFFVDNTGKCFAVFQTTQPEDETKISGGGWGPSLSIPSGKLGLTFLRTKQTIITSGDCAALVFTDREEVTDFTSKLKKALEWKSENIDQSKLFKL